MNITGRSVNRFFSASTVRASVLLAAAGGCVCAENQPGEWVIDTPAQWADAALSSEGFTFTERGIEDTSSSDQRAVFKSGLRTFSVKTKLGAVVFEQTPEWNNWQRIPDLNPPHQSNAPVLITVGEGDYWLLGEFNDGTVKHADLCYHAWHSTDMVHWEHQGPVGTPKSRWVTTAEHVDGTFYIYYDRPNDEDPHLILDTDLTDGKVGRDIGLVFDDPSHGSDCGVIRDEDGRFHLIYEDWSPINAREHSWDSPLGGHAVSPDGIAPFEALEPVIDRRTTPTGRHATYPHPHITPETGLELSYEIHEPDQDAFGDYTVIKVGGRYYVFCDYDPADGKIGIGRWMTDDLGEPFQWLGSLVSEHPDPTIGFAEGRFYLIIQRGEHDYVSPGPWVSGVSARAGVDVDGDGTIDNWTPWREVSERYERAEGFTRIVRTIPATLDTSALPAGLGFGFEVRVDQIEGQAAPVSMERVTLGFE